MFILGAVPDDMAFEFDPVSESSDEIEPQSEIGGDSLAWAARKTALEPRIQFRSDKAGDNPPEAPGNHHRRQRRRTIATLFTISTAITWM